MSKEEEIDPGRVRLSFKAHQLFKDYEVTFEYYRTLHEQVYRGGRELEAALGSAVVRLAQAHAAWRRAIVSPMDGD